MSHLHDDPILTAYALGELPPAEAMRIERRLANDPAAQAALIEIQKTCGLLESALAPRQADAMRRLEGQPARRWRIPLAAAACVAAALAIAAVLRPRQEATVAVAPPAVKLPVAVEAIARSESPEEILPNPFVVRAAVTETRDVAARTEPTLAIPPVRLQLSLSCPDAEEMQAVGKLFAFDFR